ncbi:MAG TPA: tail fiber domain-containing protein, partial [Caldithrix sp.]|nr:tail fiber domain-containing protein [Caldithrix sp.]
ITTTRDLSILFDLPVTLKLLAMKKLIIFCLTFLIFGFSPLFSQVKYTSAGKLGIGTTSPSSTVNIHGSSPMLEISNTGNTDTGILFYKHGSESTQFGKLLFKSVSGVSPTLKLWVGNSDPTLSFDRHLTTTILTKGKYESQFDDDGIKFDCSGYGDMSTIHPVNDWAGNLGASNYEWATLYRDHVYYSILTQQCDIDLKTNIREVKNPLEKMNLIRGVQYDLKENYYQGADERLRAKLLEDKKDMYGFIAQELDTVFPELVTYREETGEYAVNMIGMIPILVEAIKAQQNELDSLKVIISSNLGNAKKSIVTQSSTNPLNTESQAILYQNSPNPFDEETIIKYFIPSAALKAMINVYDLQGSQMKSLEIFQKGNGEIKIPAYELDPGLFIYNLIVDGVEVGSRRMILTD